MGSKPDRGAVGSSSTDCGVKQALGQIPLQALLQVSYFSPECQ